MNSALPTPKHKGARHLYLTQYPQYAGPNLIYALRLRVSPGLLPLRLRVMVRSIFVLYTRA